MARYERNKSFASEDASSSDSDEAPSESWVSDGDEDDDTHGNGDDQPIDQLCELYREAKEIEDTARGDITGMRVWRIVVIAVIFVTYAAATTGTFIFLQSEQADDSEERYVLFTETITQSCHRQFARFRFSMTSMAQTITAAGMVSSNGNMTDAESTFPFVRMPMFEVAASQARASARVLLVTWNPLVDAAQRNPWAEHVASEQDQWWTVSKQTFEALSDEDKEEWEHLALSETLGPIPNSDVWHYPSPTNAMEAPVSPYVESAPVWHVSPPHFASSMVNFNMLSEDYIANMVQLQATDGLMSAVNPRTSRLPLLMAKTGDAESLHSAYAADPTNASGTENASSFTHPHSVYVQPVYETLYNRSSKVVGFVSALLPWDNYLANLVTSGEDEIHGIDVVLRNSCGQSYTYRLNGPVAKFVGEGDLHDSAFDESEAVIPLLTYDFPETKDMEGHCVYSFSLFLSADFNSEESSNLAAMCCVALVFVFAIMAGVFYMFDRFVRRRNVAAIHEAAKSNAIVSSLFPAKIKERLFAEKDKQDGMKKSSQHAIKPRKVSDDVSVADSFSENFMYDSKPIADLFPETTILFADIVGFTAWSSVREPTQVFMLLETLYRAFDAIAKKRRIFKVETIGDCYVAVAGLPEPRKDHAIAMARFASDCMNRMLVLTRRLEVSLGPDTGELSIRMGLHSGPVTAGVLRGERGRFQLFGDTMNTAARMESNGERGKIQISQFTADLLIAAGKASWLSKRDDLVHAKGKGAMQTFWLNVGKGGTASVMDTTSTSNSTRSGGSSISPKQDGTFDTKATRLIEWNVETLLRPLKQMEAHRRASPSNEVLAAPNEARFASKRSNVMDEVKEKISLPQFQESESIADPESITLDPRVVDQLKDFVEGVASLYNENSFHNFDHASHVTMSVVKLLSRIVAHPTTDRPEQPQGTYGITSDPLTQFSCIFSALIHDAGHSGVPNAQVIRENAVLAKRYQCQSVAEQNSVDVAWNLLRQDRFADLRRAIYQTDEELVRFRKLVVHCVMATDIFDKELKALRNQRWDCSFACTSNKCGNVTDLTSCKATVVIEHLIQASDVAHTMQHWHVYRKWNGRFFAECYQAFLEGRAETDPAEGWYQGELGFFDHYIIPLAQKLKDCGVFGVSSDEYLNYAIRNRKEWEKQGRDIVDELVELARTKERRPSHKRCDSIERFEL